MIRILGGCRRCSNKYGFKDSDGSIFCLTCGEGYYIITKSESCLAGLHIAPVHGNKCEECLQFFRQDRRRGRPPGSKNSVQ